LQSRQVEANDRFLLVRDDRDAHLARSLHHLPSRGLVYRDVADLERYPFFAKELLRS
jgi:hypothetical protein